jgi:hypothetical protein
MPKVSVVSQFYETKPNHKWPLHAQHDLTVANISGYDYNAKNCLGLKQMNAIEIKNVCVRYGPMEALCGISLEIASGDYVPSLAPMVPARRRCLKRCSICCR